jgi:hypothetical protein
VRDIDLLPRALAAQSRMEREIALPYPLVLEAVDALAAQGVFMLGWEALATYPDGGFGAYPSRGVVHFEVDASLRDDPAGPRLSAEAVRETIVDEATTRKSTPPRPGVELIFCVTGDI